MRFRLTFTALFVAALLGAAVTLNGCGGSSTTITTTPPPPSATMPSITPATGTYTAAQTVAITDTTPGATIYYTTDGKVPTTASSIYSKALTVSVTTTVQAIAQAPQYNPSGLATATLTINIPQTIALPNTLLVALGSSLTLDSSIVTASSSCGPSAVTWTVVINDTDQTINSGGSLPGVFATWTTDSSNKTWGSISSGNTFSDHAVRTYTVTGRCGTASASSQLTVSDPAPTITAVTCTPSESTTACVVPSTGGFESTLTGTGYIDMNLGINFGPYVAFNGTTGASYIGPCLVLTPDEWMNGMGGTLWDSFTQIEQGTSQNNTGLGAWSYYVYNAPAADGTGGGGDCLDNAYTVVANSSASTAAAQIVTVQPGSSTTPGTLYLRDSTGNLLWKTSLGLGSTAAAVDGSVVYVPNKDDKTVSAVDLSAHTVQSISTGSLKPWIAATTPNGTLFVVAESSSHEYSIQAFTANGWTALTNSEPQITDLQATTAGQLLFLVQHNKATELHSLDPVSGREQILDLDRPANQLSLMADSNILLFWTGEHHLAVVDQTSFRQIAQASGLPAAVYTANGEHISLSDGNVLKVGIADSDLVFTKLATLAPAERFAGFIVNEKSGTILAVPADANGNLSKPLVRYAVHPSQLSF